MSGGANLSIDISTKGADKARQQISSVADSIDKRAEEINRKQERREARGAKKASDKVKASAGGIASTAIGTAIGAAATKSISAVNKGIAQSFDPNLSPVEKELALVNAGLDLLPFDTGAIPKAAFAARSQEVVGAAQGTGGRLNQLLGPGFQASAGLSDDEFNARFTPQIQRLKSFIEPQERARERGSQLIAENLGSFTDEFGALVKEFKDNKVFKDAESFAEKTEQTAKDFQKAVDDFSNGVESFFAKASKSVNNVIGSVD